MEETLAVVLEVISGIIDVERIVIHTCTAGRLTPAAAKGVGAESLSAATDERSAAPERAEALATAMEQLEPVRVAGDRSTALVPIARKGQFLGLIEVVSAQTERGITDADLDMLRSFALQAAVAIKDALVQLDSEEWQDEVDELVELSDEID